MTLVEERAVCAVISDADVQAWSAYRIQWCPHPGKHAYLTDVEAAHAMVAIWRHVAGRWRVPRRVYLCSYDDNSGCGLWHLTSKERRTPTA